MQPLHKPCCQEKNQFWEGSESVVETEMCRTPGPADGIQRQTCVGVFAGTRLCTPPCLSASAAAMCCASARAYFSACLYAVPVTLAPRQVAGTPLRAFVKYPLRTDYTRQGGGGGYLRFEVGLLWGGQDVGGGDVKVQENLPEGRPVSGLAVPVEGMRKRDLWVTLLKCP